MNLHQPLADALNEKALRRIFKDWGSLKTLGNHPLVSLEIVKARHRVAGYTHTAAGRGLALREVFQAALDALKPDDGPPLPEEKSWRPYLILAEQYTQGRSPEWVTEQLHISKGTYYTEQKRALEMLADTLRKWEEKQYSQESSTITPPDRPQAMVRTPFLALPRPNHRLVGRDDLLGHLKQQLLTNLEAIQMALYGLPGVGKTTLAIELAHDPDIRDHFQDGVLWAGLGCQPDILALLGLWAATVGVPLEIIAHLNSLSDRAAAIHAAIGLRRMLLVIDDAWQIETALAFRIGGPNCVHLVTTRLPNVALDFAGDWVIPVRELDLAQGLNLLAQLSPQAVEAEPDEARALVQSVGGLPLALILMGHYLRKQSYSGQSRRLRQALATLQAAETRLQLAQPHSPLEASPNAPLNTPLSLQATIGLNDAALDEVAHQALLDLSLFAPKPNTFSENAALTVIAAPAHILDTLVDHGLVESITPDRYTIHQTIADYAALQGASVMATERLVNYFVQYEETYAIQHQALEREFNNILTALEFAFKFKLNNLLIRGANAFHFFLETRGLYQIDWEYLRRAYLAAEASGDQADLAVTLHNLGDLKVKQGQLKEAQAYFRQSIVLAQATESRQLEGKGLFDLGLASWYLGGKAEDRNYFERAWYLFQELNDKFLQGFALNGLGYACEELGDFDQARIYLEQAIDICRESGNRRGEGWTHFNLGTVYLPLGDFAQAGNHFNQCLSIYQEINDQRGEGWIIYSLGRFYRQLGQYEQTKNLFEQALKMFNDLGDRFGIGWAIHNLGLIQHEIGDDTAAMTQFDHALDVFRQIGCSTGETSVYHSLGMVFRRRGDYVEAENYLNQALAFRQKISYLRGEGKTLAHLGLLYHYWGDNQTALGYCQQARQIALQIGARPNLAHALNGLAHALAGLGRLDEAADTYRQAARLRRELGQPHLALDPLAGLACVLLAQSNLSQALTIVESILDYLKTNPASSGKNGPKPHLSGADDSSRIYQSCSRVLEASQDPRALFIR